MARAAHLENKTKEDLPKVSQILTPSFTLPILDHLPNSMWFYVVLRMCAIQVVMLIE